MNHPRACYQYLAQKLRRADKYDAFTQQLIDNNDITQFVTSLRVVGSTVPIVVNTSALMVGKIRLIKIPEELR